MFNDSDYVSRMKSRQVADFDRQQVKKQFTAKYKGQIQSGMTKDIFTTKYACTEQDLQLFDELKAKIDEENKLGEAFLKGFTSKPLPYNRATDRQGQQSNESEV